MDVLKIINEEIQNVLNDNFWKWFGDSVVVDADGKPLKVYHGTREDFNEFKGDLMYFSTTPEYASEFSSAPDLVKGGSNPAVLPVYLKITNPLDLRELETYVMTDEEFLSVLFNYGVDVGDKDIQFQRGYNLPAWSWLRENYHRLVPAIKESYDGVIMYESNNARGGKNLSDLIYVVFQPNQIKSATGNNGEYSSNPDITKENLYEDIIREVRLFTQSFYDEQRQYDESIADRYAEKRFNIPDSGEEFNTEWNRELKTMQRKAENGKLVGVVKGYNSGSNDNRPSNIYMNPLTLENFEPDVRAITDVQGNLYVAQLNGDFIHTSIANAINLTEFLPWSRAGRSNQFRKAMGGTIYDPESEHQAFQNLRTKQPFPLY